MSTFHFFKFLFNLIARFRKSDSEAHEFRASEQRSWDRKEFGSRDCDNTFLFPEPDMIPRACACGTIQNQYCLSMFLHNKRNVLPDCPRWKFDYGCHLPPFLVPAHFPYLQLVWQFYELFHILLTKSLLFKPGRFGFYF